MARYPQPKDSEVQPGSLERMLQEYLNYYATDGGMWLAGRDVFYDNIVGGKSDRNALQAACEEVINHRDASDEEKAGLKTGLKVLLNKHFPPNTPKKASAGKGVKATARKIFLNDK